jgi:prevent-host-death family protein
VFSGRPGVAGRPHSIRSASPLRHHLKDNLSRYLRLAEQEEIVITRHGRPAGVLIGFASEDDWFDYRLEHHPEFLRRVSEAHPDFQAGRSVRLEDIPD